MITAIIAGCAWNLHGEQWSEGEGEPLRDSPGLTVSSRLASRHGPHPIHRLSLDRTSPFTAH